MQYIITGATGHLGRQITNQMLKRVAASDLILAVHTPAKAIDFANAGLTVRAIDYQNLASLTTAFAGGNILIYVASLTYDRVSRIRELENVIAAAETAGVQSIVAMSFFADQTNNPFTMAPFYAYLPTRLAGSKLKYAVMRNALYADPLIPYLPELIARKHLIYPVGDQALSFISQADSAEAFATVATTPALRDHGRHFLLSQPNAFTMPELGAIMTQVTGHSIGYAPVTTAEFAQIYAAEGDGAELASMYQAGARGLLNQPSHDFTAITGHAPTTMADFLTAGWRQTQI